MTKKVFVFLAIVFNGCQASRTETQVSASGPISRVRLESPEGRMGNLEIHVEPGIATALLPVAPDSVWSALPEAFARLGIAEVSYDSTRMAIGNPDFSARRIGGERLSRYFDCGMGLTAVPNADSYRLSISALAQVSGSNTETQLTVTVDAFGRPRAVSGNPVHCQSKGLLEERIIEIVEQILAGGESEAGNN